MKYESNERESHKHTTKQKKTDSKKYILNDFVYIKFENW